MVQALDRITAQDKPSPLSPKPIVAAIDVGTNSIHMVLVRVTTVLPAFTIIDREKATVRLGDRCNHTGKLTPEAMSRAMDALRHFQKLAQTLQADQILAVATSAVREAPNGRDFLRRVEQELGLFVNLISGPEEARRIYLGVLSGMEFRNQPHIVIDIGGGSTELILGDGHEPRTLSSNKVGAVRLTAQYVTTDPISELEFEYLRAYVRGTLERSVDELRSHLKPSEVPRLVGTSGTIECLATLAIEMTQEALPLTLNGYYLSRERVQFVVNHLRRLSYRERAQLPGMSEQRAEIIVAGGLILQETLALLDLDGLIVCERALREGVVVDWMLTHWLIEDRLCYQNSVRQRSVLAVAHKYGVNLESGQQVAQFAISLFDQTQGRLHHWGPEARELLWAAAILHNCGHFVSHAAHHKHSYYLIRHGDLLGYADPELEVMANLARYHRKSPPRKKHENFTNLPSKQHRLLVSQLSALMRLAVALDRRQIGAIQEVFCVYEPKEEVFHLRLQATHPNDDCALELWSLDQKRSAFEAEYGVKLVTVLEP